MKLRYNMIATGSDSLQKVIDAPPRNGEFLTVQVWNEGGASAHPPALLVVGDNTNHAIPIPYGGVTIQKRNGDGITQDISLVNLNSGNNFQNVHVTAY